MKFLIKLFLVLCPAFTFGQDFIFSNYRFADFYVNPALPGLMEDDLRVSTKFRGQWETFASAYKTLAAQIDYSPLNQSSRFCGKKLVIGPNIIQDVSGSLRLSTTSLNLNLSYSQFLDRYYKYQLLGGIQSGYTFRSIDLSKATVGSEFFNSGQTVQISDPDILTKSNYTNLAIGMAMAFYPRKNINYSLGFSAYNLIGQNITFIEDGFSKEQKRWVGIGGFSYKINEGNSLNTYAIVQIQGPFKSYLAGGTWGYHFGKRQFGEWVNQLFFGGGLRWGDAVITSFGYGNDNLSVTFNYDINISPLIAASRSVGAFEVSFAYNTNIFKRDKKCPIPIDCTNFIR